MLTTLLEIGGTLRAAPDGLKHHRYIKKAPRDERNPVAFWRVPVAPDGSFDFEQKEELRDENVINRCFYLNYKAGEADSSKPYVFGDILRSYIVKGKNESETGNYKLGNKDKKSWSALSSFTRFEKPVEEGQQQAEKSEEGAKAFLTECIKTFRKSFRAQQDAIELFIAANPVVYLHFDFGGKHWHQLEDMKAIQAMILNNFVQVSSHGYTLKAFLFKTIGVGGGSSAPGFDSSNAHKIRRFATPEEIEDLIYALDYAGCAAVRERDIKVIVLPRGQDLTAAQIERFFEKTGLSEEEEAEDELKREAATPAEVDPLFSIVPESDESDPNLLQFDFIFSLAGGTKPDVDLVELAGLERSRLSDVSQRVRKLRSEVAAQRDAQFSKPPKKPLYPPTITRSFLSILGDATKAKKKYQSHLLKVLPQIYAETYFRDPVLLPALIAKTETNIRNDVSPDFNLLKWDFVFLTRLQNTPGEGDNLMEIENSPSYQVGVLLGSLARPLRYKINSFDKNYAGLISRRITTLPDVVRLQNEINQKLIMHDRVGAATHFSRQLTEAIKNFSKSSESYDKDKCAFGFFESYFAPYKGAESGDEDTGVALEEANTASAQGTPEL